MEEGGGKVSAKGDGESYAINGGRVIQPQAGRRTGAREGFARSTYVGGWSVEDGGLRKGGSGRGSTARG